MVPAASSVVSPPWPLALLEFILHKRARVILLNKVDYVILLPPAISPASCTTQPLTSFRSCSKVTFSVKWSLKPFLNNNYPNPTPNSPPHTPTLLYSSQCLSSSTKPYISLVLLSPSPPWVPCRVPTRQEELICQWPWSVTVMVPSNYNSAWPIRCIQ